MVDVKFNPEILKWARKRLGYETAEEAGRAFRIKDYALYEQNTKESMSVSYQKKLATKLAIDPFYFSLSKVPLENSYGIDYRRKRDSVGEQAKKYRIQEGLLKIILDKILLSQLIVKEALIESDDFKEIAFIGSITTATPIEEVVAAIVEEIKFDLDTYRSAQDADKSFKYLRQCVEDSGVFVIKKSRVNNKSPKISVEVFRGFALSDDHAPFIVINQADYLGSQSFTLLHELTHLFLGQTGISGEFSNNSDKVEQFCDTIAGKILLPTKHLKEQFIIDKQISINDLLEQIDRQSMIYRVSSLMLSFRLAQEKIISWDNYNSVKVLLHNRYQESKKAAKKSTGGPSANVLLRSYLGDRLFTTVKNQYDWGYLTPRKACMALIDVKHHSRIEKLAAV